MADTPRLKVKYQTEIVPALVEQLGIKNINCVPKLEKIVVNMGVGAAAGDSKLLDAAMNDMRIITGQQPCVTRAKKSIAGFHVREGQAIGCKVTLRGDRMWEFLDRLLATALPRVRDKIDRTRGMDITFVTNAGDNDSAFALLSALGFPFKSK